MKKIKLYKMVPGNFRYKFGNSFDLVDNLEEATLIIGYTSLSTYNLVSLAKAYGIPVYMFGKGPVPDDLLEDINYYPGFKECMCAVQARYGLYASYPEQVLHEALKKRWEVEFQKYLHGLAVDFYLPEHKVVIELDSRSYHSNKLLRDRLIDRKLLKHQILVIRVMAEEFIIDNQADEKKLDKLIDELTQLMEAIKCQR